MTTGSDTILFMDTVGVPLYSARGQIIQTLYLIQGIGAGAGSLIRRSGNGKAINLTRPQFRLYGSKITASGVMRPLAFDGIWPGQLVTVNCIGELCYPVGGTPARTVLSGSDREENGFVFYRPVLDMIITTFDPNTVDEWPDTISWSMTLEELGGQT